MRTIVNWVLGLLVVVLGVVATIGLIYGFAPFAPSLWLLILLPLLVGLIVVLGLGRLIARRAGWRFGRAGAVLGLAMTAPFAALAVIVATSPLDTLAAPSPDPRGQPQVIALPTGSRLATWRVPGDGSRRLTPVIFLHGGPGYYVKRRDITMAQVFSKAGFDTLLFDQAGSGASGDLPVGDYTIARQVADIDALRKHLGAERVILWGESFGATIAARYALAHPDRVAAAIFSSPGEYPGMREIAFDRSGTMPSTEPEPPPRAMVLYLLLSRAPHLAERWMDQATAHGVSNAMQASALAGPGPRCKGSTWDRKPRPRTSSASVYTLRRLLLDDQALPASDRKFDVPALVLRGSCDYIPALVADRYVEAYPQATYARVANAGHSLLDHEAAFEDAALVFARDKLARVP